MAKKKDTISLKEAIADLKISGDDTVFVHTYLKDGDMESTVNELPNELLKKKVMKIFSHFGGVKHDYGCYRFIVNK